MNSRYSSTKTYGHNVGLSCAFRQPRAFHSHCKYIHGYSLSFKFVFACKELDDKNWVVDFGDLKDLKQWLQETFDHKLAVDIKDPQADHLKMLQDSGLAQIVFMDGVGCEKFAEHAFDHANSLIDKKTDGRCWVESCEVSEHGGNSAIVKEE